MIPRVPPTSAVSPQPISPLSDVILTSSASRTGDSSRIETPIPLGSLCSSAKVSTLVILSAEGLDSEAGNASAARGREDIAASAPPDTAIPDRSHSLRDIDVIRMISLVQDSVIVAQDHLFAEN